MAQTHNKGFSAMPASEYILIDKSLISFSPICGSPINFGIYPQLSIFDQQQFRAEVTRTIGTAESPGRWLQC